MLQKFPGPSIPDVFYSIFIPILFLFLFFKDSFVQCINFAFTSKHQLITDIPVALRKTSENKENNMKTVSTKGPMKEE